MSPIASAIGQIISRRLGMSVTRFSSLVALVGVVAALASILTVGLSLKLWTMFIGWTCFSTGVGDVRRGMMAITCLILGVLLGIGSILIMGAITPVLGQWSLPLVIFVLAVIAMLSLLVPPLDSIPGYFLGMTAFYASGLQPSWDALVTIVPAALIGGIGSALVIIAPQFYDRVRRKPPSAV